MLTTTYMYTLILIFHGNKPWVKKEGNLLMLSKLVHLFQDHSFGLYRDDGFGVLRNLPGPETERLRKNAVKIFKDCVLAKRISDLSSSENIFHDACI